MNLSKISPVFATVGHSTQVHSFARFTPLPEGFDGEIAIVPAAAFRALLSAVTTDETQSSRPQAGRSENPESDPVSELPPWE